MKCSNRCLLRIIQFSVKPYIKNWYVLYVKLEALQLKIFYLVITQVLAWSLPEFCFIKSCSSASLYRTKNLFYYILKTSTEFSPCNNIIIMMFKISGSLNTKRLMGIRIDNRIVFPFYFTLLIVSGSLT